MNTGLLRNCTASALGVAILTCCTAGTEDLVRDARLRIEQGQTLLDIGQPGRALLILDDEVPASQVPEWRRVRAHARYGAGDIVAARVELDAALRASPEHAGCRLDRVMIAYISADRGTAVAELEAMIGSCCMTSDAWMSLAVIQMAEERWSSAIASLDEALSGRPLPIAHWLRGVCKCLVRRDSSAAADFRVCRDSGIDTLVAGSRSTIPVFWISSRWDQAISQDFWLVATNRLPAHVRSVACGLLLAWCGNDLEALVQFERAMAEGAGRAEPFYRHGLILQSRGCHNEAIRDFTAALHHDPQLADALLARGLSRMQDSASHSSGIADIKEALRIAPSDWQHRGAAEGWIPAGSR